MSAPARTVAPRVAAPASSAPRTLAPLATKPAPAPPERSFTLPEEWLARIEATLSPGETVKAFVGKAIRTHVETREGAKGFRSALGLDAPSSLPPLPYRAGCASGCGPRCHHVDATEIERAVEAFGALPDLEVRS